MPRSMRARLGALLVCLLLLVAACAEGLPEQASGYPAVFREVVAVDDRVESAEQVGDRSYAVPPSPVIRSESADAAALSAVALQERLTAHEPSNPEGRLAHAGRDATESIESELDAVSGFALAEEPVHVLSVEGHSSPQAGTTARVTTRARVVGPTSRSAVTLPTPPWAGVAGSLEGTSEQAIGGATEFETTVITAKIVAFYSSAIKRLGLSVEVDAGPSMTVVSGYAGDLAEARIVIVDEGELRSVSVYTR